MIATKATKHWEIMACYNTLHQANFGSFGMSTILIIFLVCQLRAFIFGIVVHNVLWSIFLKLWWFFFFNFHILHFLGFTWTVCFEIHITMTSLCWQYSYVILICHRCQALGSMDLFCSINFAWYLNTSVTEIYLPNAN